MSYQVIARKWRPQTFSEVVYQDHVSTTIRNSIKNGRISHAYLFAGPRGVGKTTMARILAKSLNCVEGPTDNPCGKCRNCVEIRDGHSFDVMEIDGASNRGIENIRELRESVAFAPVEGRYKIYIIDEVHMLTKEAFNALLKTLEEPPPHVVFVFATTEIHQVPDTILSRCQKFHFKKMTVTAIASHLAYIVEKEGFQIDESALYAIARAAEGSMRDAQSLLDQVISFSDGHINEESALAILGIVPMESHIALLRHVADERSADAIKEISRVFDLGVDMPRYVAGFADTLRAIRLMKNGIDLKPIIGLSAQETDMLASAMELFNDEELSVFFRITTELQQNLRFATNERIYIEMAVLDLIAVRARPTIAEIVQKLEEKASTSAAKRGDEKKNEISNNKPQKADGSPKESSSTHAEKQKKETLAPINEEPPSFQRAWTKLLSSIKESTPSLYARLSSMKVSFDGMTIVLQKKIIVKDSISTQLLDTKDIALLEDTASRILNKKVTVRVDEGLRSDAVSAPAVKSVEHSGDDTNKVCTTIDVNSDSDADDPLVEKLIDMFHAQVLYSNGES